MQIEIQLAFTTTKVLWWLVFSMSPSRILQPLAKDLISIKYHTFIVIYSYYSSAARLSWLTFINVFTPFLRLVEVTVKCIHLSIISSTSLFWYDPWASWSPFSATIKAIDEALCQLPKNINLNRLPDWSIDTYPLSSAFCYVFSPTL